jgi:hypothetical protein
MVTKRMVLTLGKPTIQDYLTMRQLSLAEEAEKCHSQYDRLWYNKLIAELYWVEMQIKGRENFSSDCPLEQLEKAQ